jgi:cytochrome c oxidase cbb3-type subunit 3
MANQDVERDKLFDHEYDGIREYDNPMPGWWVWLFVASIFFSIFYMIWFHFPGPDLKQERSIYGAYDAELAAFAEQLIATYGDLEPTQQTILTYMQDDKAMAGMRSLFKGKCAKCHGADGSGEIGPNLTDDYWINVTKVTDIAEVITNGRLEQGMPVWGEQLAQTQIVLLASYVATLREHPVPGKPPEPNAKKIPPWPTREKVSDDESSASSGEDGS